MDLHSFARVAVLTGAGVSTDSGVPDFRGADGVWTRDPSASRSASRKDFMADPQVRARFWRGFREFAAGAPEPNAAHHALVDLERAGLLAGVLTQNVDGLHQRAGSSPAAVLELHGSLAEAVCVRCRRRTPMDAVADSDDPACGACGGVLRPAAVMFGDHLDRDVLGRARAAARGCDLFVAAGTSLRVEPAAGLCAVAVRAGARLVVVNRNPTPYDGLAHEVVREPGVGEALPEIVRRLVAAHA